jgi:Trypsin-like peptidase domain
VLNRRAVSRQGWRGPKARHFVARPPRSSEYLGMRTPPLADGLHWDQAVLDTATKEHLDPALVSIVALDHPPSRIVPIGTGFIIQASGAEALVCTAAHNFEPGIRQVQQPRPRHHPTTPPEFIPEPRPLDLGALKVRALVVKKAEMQIATLNWVVVDESVDLAFFSISAELPAGSFFEKAFPLEAKAPDVGTEVAALGFRTEMTSEPPNFQLRRELILRRGRVAEHHERQFGCNGPCVETSIPMLGGMSGGPVFVIPDDGAPIRPFGFVSSSANAGDDADPRIPGSSLVPLIAQAVAPLEGGKQEVLIRMREARFTNAAHREP